MLEDLFITKADLVFSNHIRREQECDLAKNASKGT